MPTNPAGEEFAKLGQDVIAETGKVQQALENMLKSAGEADKVTDELAKTQKESGKIAKQYSDAIKSVEDRTTAISKVGVTAVKSTKSISSGLSTANRMSAGLSKALSGLGRSGVAAQSGIAGVGMASREAAGHVADLRRESVLTSEALSSIKGDIDISSMTRSAKDVEDIASKLSKIGLNLKVECDTACLDSSAIDKFVEKVQKSSDLKIKITGDMSNLDTEAIDELTTKVKAISGLEVKFSPIKFEVDTSELDAARAALEAGGLLDSEIKVELFVDTSNIKVAKAALEDLRDFEISIDFDTVKGLDGIMEMRRELDELKGASDSSVSTTFQADMDTDIIMAALDAVNREIDALQANARRMTSALSNANLDPLTQDVEVTLSMEGEDLQDSVSFDATPIEAEIEKSIFKLKLLREEAMRSGASLEVLGDMDIAIAKADIAKDFVDDMDDAAQAGMNLNKTMDALTKDTGIWGLRLKDAISDAQMESNLKIVDKALEEHGKSLESVAKQARYATEAGGDIDIQINAEANVAGFEVIKDYLKDLPTDAARAAAITNGALNGIGIPQEVIDRAERAKKVLFDEQAAKSFEKELGNVTRKYGDFIDRVDNGATKLRSLEDRRIYIDAKVELGELENFESVLRNLEIPELKVDLEGMDPAVAKEFVKELSNMSDAELEVYRNTQNITASLDDLRSSVDQSASSLQNAGNAAREYAMSASTLRGEIAAQNNVLDIFVEKLNDGADDAHRFAGGLGATEGKMIGAGVAAFFLLQKLGDLVDEFKDARMELGEFNTQLAATERQTLGALPGEFDRIRDNLSLTREQAGQFFDVLRDGTKAGVANVAQLAAAGAQLRETFGGDQTARLEEYVDLLKEIPTLEQDLQIGADLDDQAAAIFALAQQGKIETLVDLQASGLAGGIQVEATDDVKLLNAAQKTEKTVQDIKDGMLTQFFPSWGPQFGAIASNTFAALGMLGGGVAALGTLRVFFGHGQKALGKKQDETTDAINGMKNKLSNDIDDMDSGGDDASTIEKGFKRALKTELARRLKGLKGNVFRRGTGRAATRIGARLGGMQGARAVQAGGGGTSGLLKALPQLTKSIYQTQGGMRGMASASGRLIKDSAGLAKSYLTSAAAVTDIAGKMSTAGTTIASAGVSVVKGIGMFAKTGGGITLIASLAGIALDKFANVVGDSSKDTGPALMKFTGGLLKAVGTIGGLAFVGASAGPVGVALGALAGVALVATGPIEDLGVSLQQTVTDVRGVKFNRFAPWLVNAGIKLEAFSGGVQELVKGGLENLKEAISGSAEAIHGLAIGAGEFIMAVPGVRVFVDAMSEAKKNLSEWYDQLELITSVEDRDIKKQEEEESARVARKLAQLGSVTEKLTKLQQDRQTGLMKSAQALEQQLGRTEAIFNGSTFALKDFNTELGQTKLEVLTEVGGNLGMFNAAVSNTTKAITQKFGAVSKTLDRERASIMRNGDLNASMREQALNVLHMKELEAVAEFAQGLDSLVDRIMEAPELMIKGIEEEIRKGDFDFALEGGVGMDQFFEGSQEGLDNVNKSMDLTFEQWESAAGELAAASQALKSETKEAKKAAGEVMPTLIEELKKADLGDVAEGLGKVVKTETGEDGEVNVTDIDTTEAVNFMEKLNSQIEELKTKEQELNDQLKGLNIDAATASFTKAKEDTVDANKKIEDWKESLSDLNDDLDGAVGDERLTLLKKQKEMLAEQSKEEARVEAARKAQLEITERVNKYVKKNSGSSEVAALYLARIAGDTKLSAEQNAQISAFIDSIKGESQKQVGLLEGEVKTNKAKLDALVKSKGLLSGVTSAVGKQVEQIKIEQKLRESARDAAEAVAREVQEINRIIEATTKDEERRVQLAKLQAANAAASGDGIAAAAALEERNAELAQAQFAAASAALPKLQAIADAQAKKAKLAEEGSKAAEVEAKAADEAVAIAEAALKEAKGDAAIKSAEEALSDAKEAAATQKSISDIRKKSAEYQSSISNQALNAAGEAAESAAEAKRDILDSITQVQDGMSTFEDGLSGRDITANLDLGDALMDAAEFSDDFAKATSEAFDITLKAAQREAEFKKTEAAAGTKRAKDALKAELKRLRASGASQEIVGRTKAEGESLIAAKDRARLAGIEKDQKEKVVEAARKEASIAGENVDIRQSVIDAEMDYLSEVGGNLDSFVSLQNQSVALEAEKLAIAEKELAKAKKGNVDGNKLLQLEANVRIQGFALKKKEMGLQKSIYDNIVGQAFGGIRSSIGARSRRLGQTTLGGGAAKTQVVTRSGMLSGAGPGGVKTIDQRNAELSLSGQNARAKFARLGAGGVEGNAPTKGVEEELFGATEKNREVNEKAQSDIAKQTDAMLKKGSIFTHDDGVQSRLDKMIALETQMVSGIGEFLGMAAFSAPAAAGGELMNALAPSLNMQKEQLAIAKAELSQATKAGVEGVKLQQLQAEVSQKELTVAKKQVSIEEQSAQILSKELANIAMPTAEDKAQIDRSNAGERVQKAIEDSGLKRGFLEKMMRAANPVSAVTDLFRGTQDIDPDVLGAAVDLGSIEDALIKSGSDDCQCRATESLKKQLTKSDTGKKLDALSLALGEQLSALAIDEQDLASAIELDSEPTKKAIEKMSGKMGKDASAARTQAAGVASQQQKDAEVSQKRQDETKREISKSAKKAELLAKVKNTIANEQIATQEATKLTLSQRLDKSRVEAKAGLASLMSGDLSKKSDEDFNAVGASMQKLVDLETQTRVNETNSPFPREDIAKFGRVMSGKLPEEVKKFKKLTEAREKIKVEERKGQESVTSEKEKTQQKARTAIATGQATPQELVDTSIEERNKKISKMSPEKQEQGFMDYLDTVKSFADSGMDAEPFIDGMVKTMKKTGTEMTPAIIEKMNTIPGVTVGVEKESGTETKDAPTADEAVSKSRFSMSVVTPEERAEGIAIGIKRAAAGSLTASGPMGDMASAAAAGNATSGFGINMSGFDGGGPLKDPGGAMSGDSFKNFKGQSAKAIAQAANAARVETIKASGGKTASGKDAFLGGAVGTAAAQLAAGNAGLTASGETRGAVVERLQAKADAERQAKAEANTDFVSGSREEGSSDMALITKYGEMQTQETRKMNEDSAKQEREAMLERSRAKDTGPSRSEVYDTPQAIADAFDEADSMFDSVSATTTGGQSLAGSEETVTGVETKNAEVSEPGAPGIAAKATPNQEVVTDTTNRALADSQQGMGKFDQNPRFQASEMSNIGNARTGVAELPVMKVEGTMRVEFNNAVFKGTIATMVGEVINTAEIVDKLTPALKSRGFLNKAT